MKIVHRIIIAVFTVSVTLIALGFNWIDFHEDYGMTVENTYVGVIYLLLWAVFSIYWGVIEEKRYIKFLSIYWGINIITSMFICLFVHSEFITSLLYSFFIWYLGPLSGFGIIINSPYLTKYTLSLIVAPLGILTCFIGYGFGRLVLRLKRCKAVEVD